MLSIRTSSCRGTWHFAFLSSNVILTPLFILQKSLGLNYSWFQLGLSDLVAERQPWKLSRKAWGNMSFHTQQWKTWVGTCNHRLSQTALTSSSPYPVCAVSPASCLSTHLCPCSPSWGWEDRHAEETLVIPPASTPGQRSRFLLDSQDPQRITVPVHITCVWQHPSV